MTSNLCLNGLGVHTANKNGTPGNEKAQISNWYVGTHLSPDGCQTQISLDPFYT